LVNYQIKLKGKEKVLVLCNAKVINGESDKIMENATIIIEKDHIISVGQHLNIPEEAQVIDLKNNFLLPGFSDVHTHFGGTADINRPPHTGRFVSYNYAEHREKALYWGVTAIRSAGDFMPDIIEIKEMEKRGELSSPHIVTAGRMIQAKAGHPGYTVLFAEENILKNELVLVDEHTDLCDEVRKLVAAGVDWIKVIISDLDVIHYPNKVPRLTRQQISQIITTAHELNRPVMAHIDHIEDMKEALICGVDSIEHTINYAVTTGKVMTEDVLHMLKEQNVWVVPTMVSTKYHDGNIEGVEPVFPDLCKAVRSMIDAGVNIGVGCDSGTPFVPYGLCVHEEMELLCDVGMSPMEAIISATSGNAKLMRCEKEFGTVAAGKRADLVVIGSDPISDIRNTRDIRMVIHNGRVVRDDFLSI